MPELTVHENVELPLVLLREDAAMRRETVDELLKALGLSQNARAYPGALSAGEKQRVAVARAVVHSPGILLADEPTADLDGISAGWVLDTIESLARKKDLTVILATHDARIFGRFESTIRLEDGRLSSHMFNSGKRAPAALPGMEFVGQGLGFSGRLAARLRVSPTSARRSYNSTRPSSKNSMSFQSPSRMAALGCLPGCHNADSANTATGPESAPAHQQGHQAHAVDMLRSRRQPAISVSSGRSPC